jgi:hypothetical protein
VYVVHGGWPARISLRAEKLNSNHDTIVSNQARGFRVTSVGQGDRPVDSPVRDAQRTLDRPAYRVRHRPPVGHRDQVDVFTEATGVQVRTCEGGAAEEDQIVGMGLERGEDRRDEMVAMDLLECDTELLCDGCCFVTSQSARVGHRARSRARASAERSR